MEAATTNKVTRLNPVTSKLVCTKVYRHMAHITNANYCPKTGKVVVRLTFGEYEMRLRPGMSMRQARTLIENSHNSLKDTGFCYLYLGSERQCKHTGLYCWKAEESDSDWS